MLVLSVVATGASSCGGVSPICLRRVDVGNCIDFVDDEGTWLLVGSSST